MNLFSFNLKCWRHSQFSAWEHELIQVTTTKFVMIVHEIAFNLIEQYFVKFAKSWFNKAQTKIEEDDF